MPLWIRFSFLICATSFALTLSGCSPVQSRSDEEKEPHFVLGQSRVNSMDYQGAVEAFEESLEVNPRSAAAHFELGWLYEQKVSDPAAAIYHYQKYLKLNPNADNAALIKQHVEACRQQLAADVLALPSASTSQQQLEKLVEQNRQLQDEVEKWRAYYASQLPKTNSPAQNNFAPQPNSNPPPQNNSGNVTRSTASQPKTYTVASGETAAAIARKAGIKLSALQSANPGVNLSKLRVGQVLNLPAQ
ncbi:MAG TPA: LysM peptidoglycan-binding domain-containing protein [Candidatus Baltobacteraceae bacterium]|nr:LysM peptidoglycan-binding domain-containing protein [Candidatus Baltobacteraceae bacterium]